MATAMVPNVVVLLLLHLALFPTLSLCQGERPSAAFVIGGYGAGIDTSILNHTELFGCGGSGASTVTVKMADFPAGVYLVGATYIPGAGGGDDGYVLACGGYNCNNNICGLTRYCFSWSPDNNTWVQHSMMVHGRYAHVLAKGLNLNDTTQTNVPIAVGYNLDTEIFNPATNSWRTYLSLQRTMFSLDCLAQFENTWYNIREVMTSLDLTTWTITTVADIPRPLQNPSKCASLIINGVHGIFVRFGYWLNLSTNLWEKKQEPPHNPIVANANGMWGFRGKPTIFGHPNCGVNGTCENFDVIQYEPLTDRWASLGRMLKPRRFHEVVEVPGSFCDRFVSTTTTTTTTPTTRTPAATGATSTAGVPPATTSSATAGEATTVMSVAAAALVRLVLANIVL